MAKAKETSGNWFEEVVDFDVDSAVVRAGLHHYVIGPPRPGFLVATGAVDVSINFHESDIDALIDTFKAIKRKMAAQRPSPSPTLQEREAMSDQPSPVVSQERVVFRALEGE